MMGTAICVTALVVTASAQKRSQDVDPEIKNYKLSMDKIKSCDVAVHKLLAAGKADPELKTAFKSTTTKKTLNEMVAAVESNPKLMALVKSSGISARDFCLVPMGVMAAGGAYMIQTQYKKDGSSLATAENIAFYAANKDEIEKITNSWSDPDRN
jgi:hypothetical protein